MAVKVLIERRIRAGFEGWVWHMLRQIRAEALNARGYFYGETWRSVDNPRVVMTLSVWATLDHWLSFSQNETRLKMDERINRVLRRPTMVRVFEDAVEAPPERY